MVSTATRIALVLFVFMITVGTSIAQSSKNSDEVLQRAEQLFAEQRFAEAYPLFSQLVSLKPNDANVNFKFGATSLYAGVEKEKAVKHIAFALKKGCDDPQAWFYLGKAHHLNYDFAKAEDAYSKYLDQVSPKEKNPLPAARNLQMCRQGSQLLSNISDIVVLEKTEAADTDFFRYYNLEEIGGRVLRTPDELLTKYDKKAGLVSVMHYPGDAVTIFFTSYGKDGSTGKDIYRASILPGGTYSTPERLPSVINTEFDEDFAFMHPDGKSFYFASRGHNSMGGYDIFKSNYDPVSDTFSKPQNLDFAVNTPDDDLFYVVDSLKRTAYFASGRSSAQGQLHVYKVMVESKPLELLFIAGGYKPEAPGLDKKARITITDELTGRPVMETIADATRGGYLLELPKSGMYRIDVLPTGGAVKHTGVFNVPVFDRPVALSQELKVVNEDGIEKLIITNSFEEPLDINLAELAADALRRRSSLDVNATDEAIRELDALKENNPGSLRDDVSLEDLIVSVGFKSGTTPQDVANTIARRSEDKQQQAKALNYKAGELLSQSAATAKKAQTQLKEAQSMMEQAEKQGPEAVARVKDDYSKLITEASVNAERATQLKEAARLFNDSRAIVEEQSATLQARAEKLNQVIENGDVNEARTIFEEQYALEQQNNESLPAESQTAEELREADRLVNTLAGRMETLEEERKSLQNQKTILKRELEATSKKNQITQINIELEAVEEDLIAVDNEAYLKNQQLAQAYKNRKQLELRKELIANALEAEGIVEGGEVFSETLLAELEKSTLQINDRLSILKDDDGETFGLGATADLQQPTDGNRSKDQQASRTDAIESEQNRTAEQTTETNTSQELEQRAIEAGVEWMPVAQRLEKWEQLSEIPDGDSPYASLRQQVILKQQREEADALVAFIAPLVEDESISEAERQQAKQRLDEAQVWQKQLEDTPTMTTEFAQGSPEEVRAAIQTRYPEAAQALAGEKGNDLNILANRLDVFNQAEKETAEAIAQLEEELIEAKGVAEIERIAEEIIVLQEVQKRISSEALINQAQVAWENDQRAIIEEDESFVIRTERQIELTETYIETLEKLREASASNVDESRLEAIDIALTKANEKVAVQRAELELAVSVDDSTRQEVLENEVVLNSEETRESVAESTPNEPRATVELNETTNATAEAARQERIASLVASIDTAENDVERDRLQAELTALLSQGSSTDEAARREVSLLPPPVTKTATEVVLKEKEAYVNLAQAQPEIRSAERKIDDASQAVALMNQQISMSNKRSDIKKYERQRDLAEKRRLDGRVERALAAAPLTTQQYETNQQAIAQSWEMAQLSSESRKPIGSHLAVEQRRAEQSFEEAQALRAEAQKKRTLQERSDLLEEALSKEVDAIAIQTRLLAVAQNAEQLALVAPEALDDVLTGELRFEEAQLRDAVVVEQVAQQANQTDEQTASAEITVIESDDEEDEISENPAQIEVITTAEEAATIADSMNENEGNLSEEERMAEAMIVNLRKEVGLPEMLPQPVEPELADLGALGVDEQDALAELLEEREVLIDARAAVVRSVEQTKTRIATIEEAILAANGQAEQEGLAQELMPLYRAAEVHYAELADYDQQLMQAEDRLIVRAAEVRSALADVTSSEAAEMDNTTDAVENNDATAADELSSEPVPAAVELAAREETRARATTVDVVDYLFKLPEVMVESVFEILDENAYSEEAPIPVDIAMPEGIVYKVQVGAFRNPISPSTFDRFAPLAGERLDNGITRYTAGVFVEFSNADEAKRSIREMGYSDAFVVAYRNGQRISITEARNNEGVSSALAENAITRANPASSAGNTEVSIEPTTPTSITPQERPEVSTEVALPDFAERWNNSKGAWLTVQIGVYSKPVTLSDLYNVANVMAEVLDGGMVRYTTGKFESLERAGAAREGARNAGINDAFVTAYIDGRRVSIAEFRSYAQSEPNRTDTETTTATYRVQIGGFSGQVPAETARALLLLESKWGVFQRTSEGKTFYYTRTFASIDAAQRVADEFRQRGAETVEVITE